MKHETRNMNNQNTNNNIKKIKSEKLLKKINKQPTTHARIVKQNMYIKHHTQHEQQIETTKNNEVIKRVGANMQNGRNITQ